jgi:hypothetical protein
VAIVASVTSLASNTAGTILVGLLTPWQMMTAGSTGLAAQTSYVGMGLQAVVAAFLVMAIYRRLSRPAVLVAATAS